VLPPAAGARRLAMSPPRYSCRSSWATAATQCHQRRVTPADTASSPSDLRTRHERVQSFSSKCCNATVAAASVLSPVFCRSAVSKASLLCLARPFADHLDCRVLAAVVSPVPGQQAYPGRHARDREQPSSPGWLSCGKREYDQDVARMPIALQTMHCTTGCPNTP